MSVKLFPHTDHPATAYVNASVTNRAQAEPYLTRYVNGRLENTKKLRSLVASFSNMSGGTNYNDPALLTLLTRINNSWDPTVFVVVLYGIHTSNGEADPHVTVQMGDGSTDDLKRLCHFYLTYTKNGYAWNKDKPPSWETSLNKWRTLNAGKSFA